MTYGYIEDLQFAVEVFDERGTLCSRGHSFKRDREWWNVFCFAEREHAEKFKAKFGGEWFEPTKGAKVKRG